MRFNGVGPTFQDVLHDVADNFGRRLADVVQSVATVAWAVLDELDRAAPGNWDELTIPQIEAVARRMDESRCNLAWVPRGELVAEVLAAPPTAIPISLLLARREDVIFDLGAAFESLASTSAHGFRVGAAQEALASFRDGRLVAAQATASAALTGVAHDLTREERLGKVQSALSSIDIERATVLDFRRRTVRRLVGHAMAGTNRHVAADYNRSASLHDVAPGQYTAENALSALLLLAGALCELREEQLSPALASARRWNMGLAE
jgi:hypothetical protein